MAYTAEDFDRFRNAWAAVPWDEPKPGEDNIIVAALRIAARVMKSGVIEEAIMERYRQEDLLAGHIRKSLTEE